MPPDDARLEDARAWLAIEELGRACAAIDPGLTPLVDAAAPLTEFAWKYRYPGDSGDPSREEAARAIELATALVEAVRARIG